jgi:hypothetical protein
VAEAGAHPVWSGDSEAIKDEFRRLEADRDAWLSRHRRADTEAERFQEALEAIAALPPGGTDDAPQIAASAMERAELSRQMASNEESR